MTGDCCERYGDLLTGSYDCDYQTSASACGRSSATLEITWVTLAAK